MTRLATLHRDRAVAVADSVIFSGKPSQVVNLPAYVKSVVAAIIVFAGYLYATTRWPVPWYAPLIALLLNAAGVVVAYLRTACTEIVIDTARITCRQGAFNRQVRSLELFRIQDVTSLHLWWQRPLVTLLHRYRDCADPRLESPDWRLPGCVMRNSCVIASTSQQSPCVTRRASGK